MKTFLNCGRIIGEILPRVTEKVIEVRRIALNIIYVTLRIQHFLKSGSSGDLPEYVQKLGPLRQLVGVTEPDELFDFAKQLSAILCAAVSTEIVLVFTE
jgi:hypothetical protein